MTQAEARQLALSRGFGSSEVDAFIQHEGGARTSADRVNSAFGGPAMSSFGPMGVQTNTDPIPGSGGGGATTPPSMAALNKVVEPTPEMGGGGPTAMALSALGGGSGSAGNVEAPQTAGMMLRALGRRMPAQDGLVLSRKAY